VSLSPDRPTRERELVINTFGRCSVCEAYKDVLLYIIGLVGGTYLLWATLTWRLLRSFHHRPTTSCARKLHAIQHPHHKHVMVGHRMDCLVRSPPWLKAPGGGSVRSVHAHRPLHGGVPPIRGIAREVGLYDIRAREDADGRRVRLAPRDRRAAAEIANSEGG
jgi:hypothetical protein